MPMALKIEAPNIEARLQLEATHRGVSASEYAVSLLEAGLPPENLTHESQASIDVWLQRYHEWVYGHAKHTPLPESATARAAFYEEEAA